MKEKNMRRYLVLMLLVFQSLTVLATVLLSKASHTLGWIGTVLIIIAIIGGVTGMMTIVVQTIYQNMKKNQSEWVSGVQAIANDSQNVLLANEVVSMLTEQTHEHMVSICPMVKEIAHKLNEQVGRTESCLTHMMQVDHILHMTNESIVMLSEKTEEIRTNDVALMNEIRGIRGQLVLAKEALLTHEHIMAEKISEIAEESSILSKIMVEAMENIDQQQQCVSEIKDSFKKIELMGAKLSVAMEDGRMI